MVDLKFFLDKMRKMKRKGLFIVFEGIDGSGKSTQLEMLAEYLKKKGVDVELTREHTRDLSAGRLIDQIVNRQGQLVPVAMQLLYVVDRVDHTARVIRPALDGGKTVISDRYFWSTIAYSNLCDKKEYFLKIQKEVTMKPDVIIWVDLPPKVALQRMGGRTKALTIFEKRKKLQKIRKGYQWLAEKFPKQCIVVDGSKTINEIHLRVVGELLKRKVIKS